MDINEMKEWYLIPFKKYVDFEGRASRMEFWTFVLINLVISAILANIFPYLGSLFSLAIIVPSIAVSVRRLHDVGKTGWMLLVGLIPLVGLIILIYFYVQEGDSGPNEYGIGPTMLI
tara:strand:+ start:73177 stop:73527 length:351 start_codon:yes stop_codon:yes gene_type:complete